VKVTTEDAHRFTTNWSEPFIQGFGWLSICFFIKNVLEIKKVVSLRPQKTFFSINHLKEGSVLK